MKGIRIDEINGKKLDQIIQKENGYKNNLNRESEFDPFYYHNNELDPESVKHLKSNEWKLSVNFEEHYKNQEKIYQIIVDQLSKLLCLTSENYQTKDPQNKTIYERLKTSLNDGKSKLANLVYLAAKNIPNRPRKSTLVTSENTKQFMNLKNIEYVKKFMAKANKNFNEKEHKIKQERKRNEVLFKASALIEKYKSKMQKMTQDAKKSKKGNHKARNLLKNSRHLTSLGSSVIKGNYDRQNQLKNSILSKNRQKLKEKKMNIQSKRQVKTKDKEQELIINNILNMGKKKKEV
jgi:hypothetical protein